MATFSASIKILGGTNSVSRGKRSKETAHVCKRESQNGEGAKGAVGEGESR